MTNKRVKWKIPSQALIDHKAHGQVLKKQNT